jgi:hypothetical protein
MREPDQVQTLTLSDEGWRLTEKEFPKAADHRPTLEQTSAELVALKGKGGGKRGGGRPPFGPRVVSLVTYLHACQMVSYNRMTEVLRTVLDIPETWSKFKNRVALVRP